MVLFLILAGLLLATIAEQRGKAGPGRNSRRSGKAPAGGLKTYWLLGAVVIGAVLLRFGVNWIVVAGGMALAALRSIVPLMRLLPLLQSLRRGSFGAAGSSTNAGPSGPGPRSGPPPSGNSRMTRNEALAVFGLDENATHEDVQREYKRLMRRVHPDLGGSSYLAAKINEAKDVLS